MVPLRKCFVVIQVLFHRPERDETLIGIFRFQKSICSTSAAYTPVSAGRCGCSAVESIPPNITPPATSALERPILIACSGQGGRIHGVGDGHSILFLEFIEISDACCGVVMRLVHRVGWPGHCAQLTRSRLSMQHVINQQLQHQGDPFR